jgi:hypothetical protein
MSRKRFSKGQEEEFKRLKQNAQAKVRRVRNKFGKDVSADISVPKSIHDFGSKSAYEDWRKNVEDFTNRGNKAYQFVKNQHGVVASKKDIQEIAEKTKIGNEITEKINEEMEKKPFFSDGKIVTTVGERRRLVSKPDTAGINKMADFDFENITSEKVLKHKREMADKRAEESYYENRMEVMKRNFINQVAMSHNSDSDELIELMKNIPADDFYEMYNMFDEMDFAVYDSEGQYIGADEPANHVAKLSSYVERYYKGKLDMDYKDF